MSIAINQIQTEMRAAGSHWWDPDAMRMFGTKVVSPVYSGRGGIFFVTNDKNYDGSRAFTVRQYDPEDKSINTIGEVCGYRSKVAAVASAKDWAGSGADENREKLNPISEAEQFLHDLQSHGCPLANSAHVRSLMAGARKHHKATEHQCNGDEQGDEMRRQAERAISTTCRKIGCGVRFSGDPRGATVKLIMPDGYTDDWGREGLCVPQ